MNVKKIDENKLPILFGEKNRPSEVVTNLDDLKVEGQAFESYSPKAGAIYRFPALNDAVIKKQPVQEGGTAMQFLIGCEMSTDGGNTFVPAWLSINSLAKRDAKQNPVHPTWYALGNVYARAAKLCEMGEIKAAEDGRDIDTPVFDKGRPVYEIVKNEKGEPVLNKDGEAEMQVKTRPQKIYDLTPAA